MDVKAIVKKQNTTPKFAKWVKTNCKTTAKCADVYKAFIKAKYFDHAAVIFKHWKALAVPTKPKLPTEEEE